jgi:hypothetical protein
MLKELLDPETLWQAILLQLVGDLAKNNADSVAAKYTAEALRLVQSQQLTKPADIVRVTLNRVEQKQGWSNSLVKMVLFLKGTTRSKEKAKFAEATLAVINEKQLKDPGAIVAETIAVVRAKQDWDSVTQSISPGG